MKSCRNFGILSLLILTGCFGSNGKVADHKEGGPTKPIVEATIEYPGPSDKWAGPQDFSIKVTTLRPGRAQIMVRPALGELANRSPSSQSLPVGTAREELARLGAAMQEQEGTTHGCTLAVKVKLLRADGTLVEKQACRGQPGWPRVASEVTNHFIEVAMLHAK